MIFQICMLRFGFQLLEMEIELPIALKATFLPKTEVRPPVRCVKSLGYFKGGQITSYLCQVNSQQSVFRHRSKCRNSFRVNEYSVGVS